MAETKETEEWPWQRWLDFTLADGERLADFEISIPAKGISAFRFKVLGNRLSIDTLPAPETDMSIYPNPPPLNRQELERQINRLSGTGPDDG